MSGEYFFDREGLKRLVLWEVGGVIGRINRRYFLDEDGFVQISAIDDGRSSHNDLNGSDIDTITKRKHGFGKRVKVRLDET